METVPSPPQLVYISDDETSAENVRGALESSDLAVDLTVLDSGADTGSPLDERAVDCVLSPYPTESGAERLERLRETYPDLAVLAVLTDDRAGIAADAIAAGAADSVRESILVEYPEILHNRIRGAVGHATGARTGSVKPDAATPDDITADGALRRHVAEAIVENFPKGAVTLVDTDLRYRLAGGKLFEQLPIDPDDVIGSHIGNVDAGDRELFVQSYRDALEGTETDTETVVAGRTLIHRTVPVSDSAGSVVAAVGMTQDITERKERERELQHKQGLLDNVQSVGNVGGWEVDLRSDTMHWTEEVYRIHEVPREYELTPEEGIEFYHPDDREIIERAYENLLDSGESYDMELRIVTANDTVRWVRTQGEPWIDEDGEIVGARGAFHDITESRERERELQRKSRAIEEAPVGVVMTDPSQTDNPMTYVNRAFLEMSGYDRQAVLGRNCRFMQGDERDPESMATIREAIDDERPVSTEIRNYRADGTEFWNHLEIAPVHDDDGDLINFVGFQQDVTERIEHERALEKRERILHELHVAYRESYPLESERDVSTFIVDFLERAFEFEYVSVKRFDEGDGVLRPVERTTGLDDEITPPGEITPGEDPLWEAYRSGDVRMIEDYECGLDTVDGGPVDTILAVPIDDFGLIVVGATDDRAVDKTDQELIEVLATNAATVYESLRQEQERMALADELDTQERRLEELRDVVDEIQTIQRRITDSESRDALETNVCAELVETPSVDFAWIGHPQSSDVDLTPTAWAGDDSDYLDAVLQDAEESLPAKAAAARREQYYVSNIAEQVLEAQWAKEALSSEFTAALSVPLVYDDVLYGVLTVYSTDDAGFDSIYEDLIDDVASLVVGYSRILEQRHAGSEQEYTELEFELTDNAYPLQRLATETGSRIDYDTVAETTDETVRILVTVTDGDPASVFDRAQASPSVLDTRWFGDRESDQLSLTVQRPFLATAVGKHGGKLVEAVSEPESTRLRVTLQRNVSTRPLLDALTNQFHDIDLVAQRQRTRHNDRTVASLTDRQLEILNAAYHGGYYESPRQATGEDLAKTFDISGPAVSKHLQAAHSKAVKQMLEPDR